MPKIKVIYVEQASGLVDEYLLDDLISKGKIAAYCGSRGWVGFRSEEIETVRAIQKREGNPTRFNGGKSA